MYVFRFPLTAELVVKDVCRTGNQRKSRKRMNKYLHDIRKGGGIEGLFGEWRVTSASPRTVDLENWALDFNLGPKTYFRFSTNALRSLSSCEHGTWRRCQVCRNFGV